MKNFVISLASENIRRKHIADEFSKHHIDFEFFDAVSIENKLAEYSEKFLPALKDTQLTNGEKGCLLSHLALWQKCIDENLPFIVIFEDDVILGRNVKLFLNDPQWLNPLLALNNPFLLRLETFLMPVEQQDIDFQLSHDHKLVSLKSVHFGTAGYIISQPLAKMLLQKFKLETAESIKAIDNWLFDNELFQQNHYLIYQLSPAICIQEQEYTNSRQQKNYQLPSQLQNERKIRDKKLRKPRTLKQRLEKVIFNLKRIILRLGGKPISPPPQNQDLIIPFNK